MATPNYGYEKRQRELAKKKKKEEKARAKAAGKPYVEQGGDDSPSEDNGPDLQPSQPAPGTDQTS